MCRSAGDHFDPGFQDYVLAAVLVGEGGPIKDLQVVSAGSPPAPHVPCSSLAAFCKCEGGEDRGVA
jgi:hypothetical protein